MKKKFEIPAVDIHMFQLENVITSSGGDVDTPQTANEKAAAALGTNSLIYLQEAAN